MSFLRTISESLDMKIRESSDKWNRQQQALRRNEEERQAKYLKAELQPHLNRIFRENLFFRNNQGVQIAICRFDEKNNLWRIGVETMLPAIFDIEMPRVSISLNGSIDLYLHQLDLEKQAALSDLSLRADAVNGNSVDIQIAYSQLQRKYELLNHQLKVCRIKSSTENNLSIVKIWIAFR